jgi:hypothetical protein
MKTKLHAPVLVLTLVAPVLALAQGRPPTGGAPPVPPRTAKQAAPVDLTGYWVSVVSEDWRWRMVTPVRGDFQSIPLNADGRRMGLAWDPDADIAAGLECKSYGAPALMRIPGRVHITWADEQTLKIETDAGKQTRLLHFVGGAPAQAERSWQGYSAANWERPPRGQLPPDGLRVFSGNIGSGGRSLEVGTTNLRAGYLRKNGPPYSADAKLQEFYDYHKEPNGDEWFTVTTVVTDPTYLVSSFITSTDFKKQPNGAGWDPTPCVAK